jgi:hypothetical protein
VRAQGVRPLIVRFLELLMTARSINHGYRRMSEDERKQEIYT